MDVFVVLDVIDVFVSFSSVVIEFCGGVFRFALLGNLWNRSPFLQKACSLLDINAGRDEV